MATKNNRRTVMTKLMLKTSLIELMNNKSINEITIKELCENADLNRSTFYLHYSDQYALLKDIEDEIILKTKEQLIHIESNTTVNTLMYIKVFLDYIHENSTLFQTLLCKQDNISFQITLMDVAMGQIKESISFDCPIEYKNYIFCFLMYGSIHMVIEWIESDFNLSSEKLAQLLFQLSEQSLDSFKNK